VPDAGSNMTRSGIAGCVRVAESTTRVATALHVRCPSTMALKIPIGEVMNSHRDSKGRTASPYPENVGDTRFCPECNDFLPLSEFYKDGRTSCGLTRKCRTHHSRRSYKSRQKNPQHATKSARYEYSRARNLAKYGLDEEKFQARLDEQGGCGICLRTEPVGNGWQVDHDHKTGRVRGILCSNCNTALGKFQDDPEIMKRAIEWIL